MSALVPAAVLLVAAVASRRLSSAYAKERTEQRLADALRARLCIRRRDRVYLSTERVPPWATRAGAMLVVPAAQLEAAVRFDELRGDFDPRLFDAFCARSPHIGRGRDRATAGRRARKAKNSFRKLYQKTLVSCTKNCDLTDGGAPHGG